MSILQQLGLPEHLKRPMQLAVAKANNELGQVKRTLGTVGPMSRYSTAREAGFAFVKTVVLAFAEQAVRAGQEGLWDVERIEDMVLVSFEHAAYEASSKLPESSPEKSAGRFLVEASSIAPN